MEKSIIITSDISTADHRYRGPGHVHFNSFRLKRAIISNSVQNVSEGHIMTVYVDGVQKSQWTVKPGTYTPERYCQVLERDMKYSLWGITENPLTNDRFARLAYAKETGLVSFDGYVPTTKVYTFSPSQEICEHIGFQAGTVFRIDNTNDNAQTGTLPMLSMPSYFRIRIPGLSQCSMAFNSDFNSGVVACCPISFGVENTVYNNDGIFTSRVMDTYVSDSLWEIFIHLDNETEHLHRPKFLLEFEVRSIQDNTNL